MAKYPISNEGAAALNLLANNLLINANNIIEDNQKLEQVTSSLYDDLGIYGDEILSIIHRNAQTLNVNREDIVGLAQRVKELSDDIAGLVAMGLGDVGGGGSSAKTQGNGSSGQSTLRPRISYDLASEDYKRLRDDLEFAKIEYRPISKVDKERSCDEIVERLGGDDKTKGSCSSLALAYVGNKAGFDVLDFRNGDSRNFFSTRYEISRLASIPEVCSKVVSGKDDFVCATELLHSMEYGKEYYMMLGGHASIVRARDGKYEYLELQLPANNGWKQLEPDRLVDRFGCKIHSMESSNLLMDVDSLASCDEFLDLLGYINTAPEKQIKGESGYVG